MVGLLSSLHGGICKWELKYSLFLKLILPSGSFYRANVLVEELKNTYIIGDYYL